MEPKESRELDFPVASIFYLLITAYSFLSSVQFFIRAREWFAYAEVKIIVTQVVTHLIGVALPLATAIILLLRKRNAALFVVMLLTGLRIIVHMRILAYSSRQPIDFISSGLSLIYGVCMILFAAAILMPYEGGLMSFIKKAWFLPGIASALLSVTNSMFPVYLDTALISRFIALGPELVFSAAACFLLGYWIAYPYKKPAPVYYAQQMWQAPPVYQQAPVCPCCGKTLAPKEMFCMQCGTKRPGI